MARRHLLLGVALCLVAACRDSLPTAPSDLQSGLIIYEHANYLGASAHLDESIANLDDFKGPCVEQDTDANGLTTSRETWNDCVSSVRLAPGWRATLYRDDGPSRLRFGAKLFAGFLLATIVVGQLMNRLAS